jgi:hypothetical protein
MECNLSVVVLYCSHERDLIDKVIEPLTKISNDVVVVSLSHFFTGEPDSRALEKLKELSETYKEVKPRLLQWKYIPGAPQNFWPCEMRLHGFGETDPSKKWVMFVDSDEILRKPDAFNAWFSDLSKQSEQFNAYKLSSYWYFLSPLRRSKVIEDSIVLVQKKSLGMPNFRNYSGEREKLADSFVRDVRDLEGDIFFDHFSWVRSKEILLQKVSSWSHRNDKNWTELLLKAYQEDILTTKDFVHNYEYDILKEGES